MSSPVRSAKTRSAVYDLRFRSGMAKTAEQWGEIKAILEQTALALKESHGITLTTLTGPPYPSKDARRFAPATLATLRYLAENQSRPLRAAVLAEHFQNNVSDAPQTETYCRVVLYRLKALGYAACRRGGMTGDGRAVEWYATPLGLEVYSKLKPVREKATLPK